MKNQRIAILIPARLDGIRLPRKVLLEFWGIPMVEIVRRRALLNKFSVDTFVVTGDDEIVELVRSHGGNVIRTFEEHQNGTSRCEEAARGLGHEYFIIVQGDEVLILPRHIDLMIQTILSNPEISCFNAIAELTSFEDLNDTSIVKCALNTSGNIVFMFRRSPLSNSKIQSIHFFYKVLGLFAFKKSELHYLAKASMTDIEVAESIEQMRLIENARQIRAVKQDTSYPSVNVESDVTKVNKEIDESLEQRKLFISIS